jgi:hypothetical protein
LVERIEYSVLDIFLGDCTVSGWGYNKSSGGMMPQHLQAANVTILTQEDCQSRFTGYTIYPAMLCAGGGETDACQVYDTTVIGMGQKS